MGGETMDQSFAINEVFLSSEKRAIAREILTALPEWFGIQSACDDYVERAKELPMFVVFKNMEAIGFLSLKQHFNHTAEWFVLGIKKEYQRQGIGTALSSYVEKWCVDQSIFYFQVKTLAAVHPDPFYRQTRLFYQNLGFEPLEIFSDLWGKENPCLLMIKKIGGEQ